MTNKQSTKKAPADAGALDITIGCDLEIAMAAGGIEHFLRNYSDRTKDAVRKLQNDLRTKTEITNIALPDLENVIHVFELSLCRRRWDKLPRREQDNWMKSFDKTFTRLLELIDDAPTPPNAWGFPVRMDALLVMAEAMGCATPNESDGNARLSKQIDLEQMVDSTGWTIVDALRHFRAQQDWNIAIAQELRKPRDAKAPRAFFLRELQAVSPSLSAGVVASLASVMFDEDVDDRTVRAFRPKRMDSSKT